MATIAICFGRFDGIHFGHEMLAIQLNKIPADERIVFVSPKEQEFLSYDSRTNFMRDLVQPLGLDVGLKMRTPVDAIASCISAGYNEVIFLCGADRIVSFAGMLDGLRRTYADAKNLATPHLHLFGLRSWTNKPLLYRATIAGKAKSDGGSLCLYAYQSE